MSMQEVRGHTGMPWNELADALAKIAAKGVSLGRVNWSHLHDLASKPQEAKWLQVIDRVQTEASFARAMPGLHPSGALHVRRPGTTPQLAEQLRFGIQRQQIDQQVVKLKFMTSNALSLSKSRHGEEVEQGRHELGKTHVIDRQAHQMGVHVIGIQEARTDACSFDTVSYRIVGGGASKCGQAVHHRCELWVNHKLPVGRDQQGSTVTLGDMQNVVVHAEPRLLLVTSEGCIGRWLWVVAHAPTMFAGQKSEVHLFWEKLAGLVHKFGCGRQVVLMADANASLADELTQHYGMLGAEKTNEAGQALQKFCARTDMSVPFTFSQWHQGRTTTWKHPKGNWFRKDCVMCGSSLGNLVQKSWVVEDVDTGCIHEDHLPVCLEIEGCMSKVKRKEPKPDPCKLVDSELQRSFAEKLKEVQQVEWGVDVDTHTKQLVDTIKQKSQEVFGKSSGGKRHIGCRRKLGLWWHGRNEFGLGCGAPARTIRASCGMRR